MRRCTVTSSALVGSSATMTSGSPASAIAISTRWRRPPGQLVRVLPRARHRVVDAGLRRAPRRTAASTAGLGTPRSRTASATWWPMRCVGLSETVGSCGTSPTTRPRMRAGDPLAARRRARLPATFAEPATTRPVCGSSPSSASAAVLLPEPDSPTIATRSPRCDREVDAAQRMRDASVAAVVDLESADVDQRLGARSLAVIAAPPRGSWRGG